MNQINNPGGPNQSYTYQNMNHNLPQNDPNFQQFLNGIPGMGNMGNMPGNQNQQMPNGMN